MEFPTSERSGELKYNEMSRCRRMEGCGEDRGGGAFILCGAPGRVPTSPPLPGVQGGGHVSR